VLGCGVGRFVRADVGARRARPDAGHGPGHLRDRGLGDAARDEFVTADLRQDDRIKDQSVASVVAFPLSCRGRRVGAIIGLDREPSSRAPTLVASVQRAVRVLLEPASVALDNALLLKRAEALSVTDDLTHLYNSRYLNLVLRRETKRASRSGRPLSLLFIDLDGFKSINDTHGHLFGSRALVEAAAVIRGSARETDVVSRFGGDEFAVVLPIPAATAPTRWASASASGLPSTGFWPATASIFTSRSRSASRRCPTPPRRAEELVQAADKAMYLVKDAGKNGIQVAAAPADN